MELLIAAGILVMSGVGAFFLMQNDEQFDVINDFKVIKKAMKTFRATNKGLTKGIENLKPYLPKEANINLGRYSLSIDDKFLIVKKLPKGLDGNDIAKKIGGNSSYVNNKLKLAFYSPGGKEPVAVIKVMPMGNIMTTTKIEYSHENSIVDNNEIKKVEWKNNEEYFDEEGVHTVKLRVMDKHFRWSEWESLDIFVSEAKGIKKLSGGGNHLFVVHRNGSIDAFGGNEFGQLGNCTNQDNQILEEVVQIKHVDDIAVGDFHTLFLKSDRKVFATGNNEAGQLGIGSKNNSKIPKLCWGIENIIQVSSGNKFSAAVTSDGFVYTWGQNEAMCLGHGKNHLVNRPVRVDGVENVKEISLGHNYILALSYDGVVKAWGVNDHGELGLGFKSKSSEPTVTNFKDIKSVCAGKGFSYGITSGNRVLAVGNNQNNQLGIEGEKTILFPKEIPGLKDIKKIVTCNELTLALDMTGNVYTWGQFSPMDQSYSAVPFKSERLKYIKDIAATMNHGFAINSDDEVFRFSSKDSEFIKMEFKERVKHELPKGDGEDSEED